MTMSSRERVLAALRLEQPDRVPHFELAIDRALAERIMGWPASGAASAGTMRKNPYTIEEAKGIAQRLGHDGIGFVLRAPEFASYEKGTGGRLFPADGLIRSQADLALIELPDPTDDALYSEAEQFAANKGDYACGFITRIGLIQTILSLGMEHFALMLYDDRDLVEALLDLYFDWTAAVAERVNRMEFDFFCTTDDFAFHSAMLFSPALFRELLFERYQRVLSKIDKPWILHCDGNITEVLPLLLELGVRATHPNEKGAMDIAAVKREFGDRLCVMGNVELGLLTTGTPEQVAAEVRELIRTVAPGGGYILTSGNSLASYLSPENVLAMADAVRTYGQYPLSVD